MTKPVGTQSPTINLDLATHGKLKALARALGRPMSNVAGDIIRNFFQHRQELGEEIPGDHDRPQTPLLQDIVDATEGRLVQTISRQTEHVIGMRERQEQLQRTLELTVQLLLQVLPLAPAAVMPQQKEAAKAHYEKWKSLVVKAKEG